MTNIKIEEFNFIKTKGFWWIIAFGWIPFLSWILTYFLDDWKDSSWQHTTLKLRINKVPFLFVQNNENIGRVSYWGGLYIMLAVSLSAVLVFMPEYLPNFLSWRLGVVLFSILPMLVIGIYLILYSKRYDAYIVFVNNFLNNVMLKNQKNGRFDSPIYLNSPIVAHDSTILMIDDLKKNNVLSVENDMTFSRKNIIFTVDFQQVLEKQ